MLKIYGSMLCKDCVQCCEDLEKAKVEYVFLDFAHDLSNLKEFLALRHTNPVFKSVIENGSIGIPCIVTEDDFVTLSWDSFVK